MATTETIITPRNDFWKIDLRELWQYRDLLYFFTWRDLKVRYKQTAIGVAWAVFQPLLTMVVFTIFFGRFAKIPSEGVPYPIFVFCGLLLWQFFVASLTDISNCLVSNQSIVTKVYFPRIILPLSYIFTNFIDFVIGSLVLILLMLYYGFAPHLSGLLILPFLLFITFLSASGLGLFLASINVKYRDVRYVLPFFIQLLLFVTPVIYPASLLGKYTLYLGFNPMAGVISTARAVLFGLSSISWLSLGFSFTVGIVLFIIGVYSFKQAEVYFADIV